MSQDPRTLEGQIEMLNYLKDQLLRITDILEQLPDRYRQNIDKARAEGLVENFYEGMVDRYIPPTKGKMEALCQKIRAEDIREIDDAIASLEHIRNVGNH